MYLVHRSEIYRRKYAYDYHTWTGTMTGNSDWSQMIRREDGKAVGNYLDLFRTTHY